MTFLATMKDGCDTNKEWYDSADKDYPNKIEVLTSYNFNIKTLQYERIIVARSTIPSHKNAAT
jgi:hypothetical protein